MKTWAFLLPNGNCAHVAADTEDAARVILARTYGTLAAGNDPASWPLTHCAYLEPSTSERTDSP